MKTQIIISIIVVLSATLLSTAMAENKRVLYDLDQAHNLFEDFITKHNREYTDDKDRQVHFDNFKQNLKKINDLNKGDGAVYGINKFADLSPEEMKQRKGFGHN